ncbi:hypothetical protein I4F81_002233 [Pyropia yezoensis]|uniref:Uncharacterized protein n=1 Tax=Pyropia yezoensis TaxID=2788 RepID=A0ACC3BNS1_PYRYE|nr:hypothetical protein I4F81_002233 [Neopyropia yezoensis]
MAGRTHIPPTLSVTYGTPPLEYSVHTPPRSMARELAAVFVNTPAAVAAAAATVAGAGGGGAGGGGSGGAGAGGGGGDAEATTATTAAAAAATAAAAAAASTLLVIPVLQRSRMPLVAWGAAEAAEKDALLERFLRWATAVRAGIAAAGAAAAAGGGGGGGGGGGDGGGAGGGDGGGGGGGGGWWADATDPASGQPHWGTPGAAVFSEPDAVERLLRYGAEEAGGCRIVRHPAWGAAVYLSSFFTNAPLPVVAAVLARVNGLDEGGG